MFFETGSFVSTAGRGMGPVKTGGHFDHFDTGFAEFLHRILVHCLSDAFQPGGSQGAIIADLTPDAVDGIGDEAHQFPFVYQLKFEIL